MRPWRRRLADVDPELDELVAREEQLDALDLVLLNGEPLDRTVEPTPHVRILEPEPFAGGYLVPDLDPDQEANP